MAEINDWQEVPQDDWLTGLAKAKGYEGDPGDWIEVSQAVVSPAKPDISKTESAISGAADMASFGFGDEIMAGLTSPVQYLGGRALGALGAEFNPEKDLSKLPLSAIYSLTKQDYINRDKAAQEANPLSYLAGQVAGAVGVTGALGAGTKAGQALGNFASRGLLPGATGRIGQAANLASKAAVGSGIGAASSGLYGLGAGEDGKRLENAGDSALYGAMFGGAAPAVGSALGSLARGAGNIAKGITSRGGDELGDIASGMKAAAGSTRAKMQEIGATLSKNKSQELAQKLDSALGDLELIPELSPKTTAIVKRIKESASNGEIKLNTLDQYRRMLRSARDEDTVAASAVRKAIDNTVNSLKDEGDFAKGGKKAVQYLNDFRKEYTQASKFDDVAEILQKADGDPNKIRAGLTRFLNNKDNTLGWADAEKKALRAAAKDGLTESVLKGLGAFGFDARHFYGPAIGSGLAGAAFGGPAGIGLAALGTASRQARKYAVRGEAENLLKLIESGQVPQSTSSNILKMLGITPTATAGQMGAVEAQPLRITPQQ